MDILGSNYANGVVINLVCKVVFERIVVKSNKLIMQDDFKLLDILHHFTSGFKALFGEMAYFGLDEMR